MSASTPTHAQTSTSIRKGPIRESPEIGECFAPEHAPSPHSAEHSARTTPAASREQIRALARIEIGRAARNQRRAAPNQLTSELILHCPISGQTGAGIRKTMSDRRTLDGCLALVLVDGGLVRSSSCAR